MKTPTNVGELLLTTASSQERCGQVFLLILQNNEIVWGVYLGEIDNVPQFYTPTENVPAEYYLNDNMIWIPLEGIMTASRSDIVGTLALTRLSIEVPENRRHALKSGITRIRNICSIPAPNLKPVPPMPEAEARAILRYPEKWPLHEACIKGIQLLLTLEYREVRASDKEWPEDTAGIAVAADILTILARKELPAESPTINEVLKVPQISLPPSRRASAPATDPRPKNWRQIVESMSKEN